MPSLHSIALTLGLCALLSTIAAKAADWPQWQGPARDNISLETGLLKQWPAEGPALVWKATGLGGGFSGVSVATGRIYTMGDGADSSYVRALDAATGKLLWSSKVGQTGGGSGFPGPRCTPTVDGDLVFALGQFGDLVCLDATTGTERWRRNMQKDLGGQMASGWGYSESPLVEGDKLICTPGGPSGTVAALNKSTGEVIWRTKDLTEKASYVSPLMATIGGVRQLVHVMDQCVVGINPADGSLLWRGARPARIVATTPVIDGNLVYVSSGYGIGCNAFRVDVRDGKFTAEQVYASKELANHHGGVVKVGANVFGYSDTAKGWTMQDLKTGNIVWVEKTKLGKGSVTSADGMLYLRLENGKGTVVLLDPSAGAWNEKGRFDQADRSDKQSWPHPVVANGRLYLRDQDALLAYEIKAK
ncbi:MAG: PQQ-binding-like beta-propeller repeat protein [Verrucomicrobiota bacterium]